MTTMNRFNVHKKFAVLSVLTLLVGFSDVGSAIFSGLTRALGCIFFILFLIFYFLKNELTDDELPACNGRFEADKISAANGDEHDRIAA
jgi:hypothetical protein